MMGSNNWNPRNHPADCIVSKVMHSMKMNQGVVIVVFYLPSQFPDQGTGIGTQEPGAFAFKDPAHDSIYFLDQVPVNRFISSPVLNQYFGIKFQ